MAIVKDHYVGHAHIMIDDSMYINRTPEEHRESIRRAFAVADEAEARLAREAAERAAKAKAEQEA